MRRNTSKAFRLSAAFAVMGMVASSTAYAAPARVAAIDPLVSVSVFGTSSSRAAVCAAGAQAAAAAAGTAAATAAAAQPATTTGCVLPVVDAVPVATVEPLPVVPVATAGGLGIGTLPLLLGLVALAGLAAALLGGGDKGEGDPTPVSP